jgi:hypothetical protein
MRGTVRATGMKVHTIHDTNEIPEYPIGLYVGGSDPTEVAIVVLAWKGPTGGSDVTVTVRIPVGVTIPVEGFYRILNSGTTLTTDGQVAYYFGPIQR